MLPVLRCSIPGLRVCVEAAFKSLFPRRAPVSHSRLMSLQSRPQNHSCTVDPQLQERFVFVDYVALDQNQDQHGPAPDQVQNQNQVHTRSSLASPHRKRRGLVRQPQTLKTLSDQDRDLTQFHDAPPLHRPTLDQTEPDLVLSDRFSSVSCSGCGALLQSADHLVPGFLPLHLFRTLQDETKTRSVLCQRCHSLIHHQQLLQVQLNHNHFRDMISSGLRSARALVLLVVDLVDLPDSIIPDLQDLIGPNKQVAVVGTKVDLLPVLTASDLALLKRQVQNYSQTLGLQLVSVNLVSAKTGFGIEDLVSGLQRVWGHRGDLVLVGSANAGKSTLFNALLDSDFSRTGASQVYRRATVSPWPGTTLNLLKFPILNPTPLRLLKRQQRLHQDQSQTESKLSPDHDPGQQKTHQDLSRQGYVTGRVGRTFQSSSKKEEIEFDPDVLAFGETEDGLMTRPVPEKVEEELSPNELEDAHWLHDTPGIIKDQDILNLLTEPEVRSVVPVQPLVPRTFVLKPGTTLFVGGLVRIDFIQGRRSCWFSVLVSGLVPIHITSLERAEGVYEKHAGNSLLGVPMGGAERMKNFPKLVSMDLQFEGKSYTEAAADIKISAAGWVAVTPTPSDVIQVKVWAPEAAGVSVRAPLLPRVVMVKGSRIRKSAAYKTHKPSALTDQSAARKNKK